MEKDKHLVEINPKYADDISFIRTDSSKINQIERLLPNMLKEENLTINENKTEKFKASLRGEDNNWKKCRYLGTMLDTEEDFKRRKNLSLTTFNTLENVFHSRNVSEKMKLRVFNIYIESIFMYNSELWTITKNIEESIDSFHRKQLRKLLNIYWPNIITNEELYQRTNEKPWSEKIFKRRLKWLGHLLRLPENTPAKIALDRFIEKKQVPVGRPTSTWLKLVLNDIKKHSDINIGNDLQNNIKNLTLICMDRKYWKTLVGSMMLRKSTSVQ